MKKETIETFIARAADACHLLKLPSVTLMMQARDTDPLSFDSVVRVGDCNPFTDDGAVLNTIRQVSVLLRDRTAAHREAERAIHMADLNRTPDFVNAYLTVKDSGEAKLFVHHGNGLTTHIINKTLSDGESRKVA